MLGNDISENPGPFDNEISIFHLNIRSIRHKFFEDKKHLLYYSRNYYFLPINQYSDLP
jgi:hypothetical protein